MTHESETVEEARQRILVRRAHVKSNMGRFCPVCGAPFHPTSRGCRYSPCMDEYRVNGRRTKEPRGVVCRSCNSRVGYFERTGHAGKGWPRKLVEAIKTYLDSRSRDTGPGPSGVLTPTRPPVSLSSSHVHWVPDGPEERTA